MNHLTIEESLTLLSSKTEKFLEVFTHGSLTIEIYKPDNIDLQKPHSRDEVYIIAEGLGSFKHLDQIAKVKKGDFLFVAAGDEHRFFDFSEDFSTWVIFYGPEGGE